MGKFHSSVCVYVCRGKFSIYAGFLGAENISEFIHITGKIFSKIYIFIYKYICPDFEKFFIRYVKKICRLKK